MRNSGNNHPGGTAGVTPGRYSRDNTGQVQQG